MRTRNAERVLPSLLERLTDHAPEATSEVREHRASSARAQRLSVMRDIGWLLNARGIASAQEIARYPCVADSVLNFGFAELAGKSASDVELTRIERLIAEAIGAFEPRIVRGTLRVRAIQSGGVAIAHNALAFIVEGDLHAHPVPERLYLRTELDLEAGKANVYEEVTPR
ncbi:MULTISPECIES: type VI secretion system baseplate subunit TssE [unclassified Paraburkholderia]|uniref:type VI secretion system baseplate subunit TssE n=1 Tax=unclassified Paraburkholderia TaxID=2615204 RepID=UPI0020B7BB74|nr:MULTISPECIES: type VI secretion system baseplate subunit TssE [unclassified Paraburkholderia]MCP3718346.1 type VI secretion system baseplate subunit TssE [Paraburkholderia sp. CNPSo 3281]MCX5544308.1 type VI secretion system baseplate subunit TssE [Paraburkholderia sp. CNPSo 3076]